MDAHKRKYTENTGWNWFLRGSVIWIFVLLFLGYLIYRYAGTMLQDSMLNSFLDILLKIIVLAIVIGLFLNFFILQNYYIAVSRIVQILDENSDDLTDDYYTAQNPASYIFQSFSQFYQDYDTYKSKVEQQKDILFENFLVRLLKGHIQNENIYYQLMEEYDFDIRGNEFILVLFDVISKENEIADEKLNVIYFYA